MLDVETLGAALKLVKKGGGGGGEGAAIIDDSKILTSTTWSSQKIVDALCPPFTVSGATVQCTPVANYPLDVQVKITPTQEGTGDPSPENVRPIVGWDAVNIHQSNGDQDNTYTVQLGQTIYGGTVDAVTGEGVETVHGIVLDGTELWSEDSGGSTGLEYFYYNVYDTQWLPSSGGTPALAKLTQKISHFAIGNPYSETVDNAGWVYSTDSANYYGIRIRMSACADVDEWKSYLAAQYAAGTPVTIAYKLATPTAFHATGGQSLPALPGTNTIYTDAGDITVTGASDPIAAITALQNRVSALESTALN